MKIFKIVLVSILALAATVLVIQNTEVVTVRFIVWELTMSRIILLSIALATGFVSGLLVATLGRLRLTREE